METLERCPICDSSKFETFIVCRDHTVSSQNFAVVRCAACGFKFTNPRPSEGEIGRYYQSDEYISHSDTSKGIVNRMYQSVRNRTLKKKLALVNSLSAKGSILDIGCGTGYFLDTCKKDGWNTMGIEPDPKARKHGVEAFGLDVQEESALPSLPSHSFEVITMWHVLEHVHRLNERVEELKRLLKPGGAIIVAVPNCSSLDAKVYGPEWAAWDVPRHLYHFTPADIEKLFSKHGLKVKQVLPMPFDSFYVSMLSEKYRTGSPRILRGAFNGLRSNIAASGKNRTWSSQIYIITE
jgi:2-polyprenyl-3-methyl-5-hydroxy-6-metoxy-1,4-benzoquinol methylase